MKKKKLNKARVVLVLSFITIIVALIALIIFGKIKNNQHLQVIQNDYQIETREKEQIITNQQETIKQKEEEIENKNNELKEKQNSIDNLNKEKNELNNKVEELNKQIEQLKISKQEQKITSRSEPITREVSANVSNSNSKWIWANISGYCSCVKCCGKNNGITASGSKASANHTIAAPSNYSFGTKIEIEGMGIFTVEDRGGAIKGNKIDVYFNSHNEALAFGRKQLQIRVIE